MFNCKITGVHRLLAGLVASAMVGAHAAEVDSAHAKSCEIHAVAMVAEMKAAATRPMTADEIKLVRETGFKSCLAQTAPAAAAATSTAATIPAVAATALPAPAAAPPRQQDSGFWGALQSFLGSDSKRKPGNDRLEQRSHM